MGVPEWALLGVFSLLQVTLTSPSFWRISLFSELLLGFLLLPCQSLGIRAQQRKWLPAQAPRPPVLRSLCHSSGTAKAINSQSPSSSPLLQPSTSSEGTQPLDPRNNYPLSEPEERKGLDWSLKGRIFPFLSRLWVALQACCSGCNFTLFPK